LRKDAVFYHIATNDRLTFKWQAHTKIPYCNQVGTHHLRSKDSLCPGSRASENILGIVS